MKTVVIETEDGLELALLCDKPKAKCGYRRNNGVCQPKTWWNKLFDCFY